MNIEYRLAKTRDINEVARLHAASWREHYRGICSDEYLDHEVIEDRLTVWQQRLTIVDHKQHVLLARDQQGVLQGFVCTYLNHHTKYGAYLDNLHVATSYQGKGLGRALMQGAASWVKENDPSSLIYLHVLQDNINAILFYDRMGGQKVATYQTKLPWGDQGIVCDYVWNLDQLIS